MSRKKQEQINGKTETFKPTTLDQIWGDTGLFRYNTLNEEEYKNSLDEMDKSDLQSHARKVGVFPDDNREVLYRKLLKEFRMFTSAYRVPTHKIDSKPISKESLRVLSEGK